jgi:hypothetical protein
MVETESGYFTDAHTQTGRNQDNGKISFPAVSFPVDTPEQTKHMFCWYSARRTSQKISARRDQRRGPIPVHAADTEKITEQSAQDAMNILYAFDVVGSLLAHENIDMAALELIPGSQRHGAQELFETAEEEFGFRQCGFSQALVLFTKKQIIRCLRKEEAIGNGSQWEDIALDASGGVRPTEEAAQAVLDHDVMVRFESRFLLEPSAVFAHGLVDPVVNEVACQLRTKFFERLQTSVFDKAAQAIQVL